MMVADEADANMRSKRYLWILFILALPVMMLMRWDVSTWLSSQVDDMIQQSGLDMQYGQVTWSGLGVAFQQVRLQASPATSVEVESFDISLSLGHLLTGTLAADVEVLWLDNVLHLSVFQAENMIHIEDIDGEVDWLKLADVQQQLPFRASGVMQVTGDVVLNQHTGKPESGRLQAHWSEAMLGLSTPEFALGDYALDVYSDSALPATWLWVIQGGEGVALAGKGQVSTAQALPQQWTMNGVVDMNIDASNSTLSMMAQAFTGSNQAKIRLSGLLLRPQTQVIR